MGHFWQNLPSWRVLDTDFSVGETFLTTWLAWQQDVQRPGVLHYVAFCEQACTAPDLLMHGAATPHRLTLTRELSAKWFGLLPGFHRFLLDHGQVVLTLCVGDALTLLRAQQFEADTIEFAVRHAGRADWSYVFKALARCCRRGTTVSLRDVTPTDAAELQDALTQNGFTLDGAELSCHQPAPTQLQGQFDPPWTLKNTRQSGPLVALPIERCAVIGAGLAGSSVAAALARRGWQVRVLDQASEPAAGASGLPVGLVVPHVSSDDCTLSRLSRAGVRLMLQQAQELLNIDQEWAPCGVLERQVGGTPKLPEAWPQAGRQWSEPFLEPDANQPLGPGLWHTQGAWIKPTALVKAWLKQPGITFQGNAKVVDLRRHNGVWELLDETGKVLCQAERVVFANACGAFQLLQKMKHHAHDSSGLWQHLPSTQGMRGMLSWDVHPEQIDASFPLFPVNGSGSVVARVPVKNGLAWFMGSSYQPDTQVERSDLDNQARNFDHLQQLLPALAAHLAPVFSTHALKTWKGTRCVTKDRLPAVGPLDTSEHPGLTLCAHGGVAGWLDGPRHSTQSAGAALHQRALVAAA